MSLQIIDRLGGADILKNDYPLVFDMLNNAQTYTPSSENTIDDVKWYYANIHALYSKNDGIDVFIKADFYETKPVVIVNTELKDETTGKVIESFCSFFKNVKCAGEVFTACNKAAAAAKTHKLKAESTFIWSDGNTSKKITKACHVDQFYEGNPVIADIEVTAPRAKNGKTTIVLYDRTAFAGELPDYTYKNVVTPDRKNAKFHMPFKGKLTVDEDFCIKDITTRIEPPELKVLLENGGTVEYANIKGIESQLHISEDGLEMSWDFDDDWNVLMDLSHFSASTVVDFSCKFTLMIENRSDPQVYVCPLIMINSAETENLHTLSSDGVVEIEKISIRWGCFAHDTKISMADGSKKKIADVRIGELLCTKDGIAEVCDIICGSEAELVYIKTANGISLKVTNNHPILTNRGFVRADELTAADVVVTERGDSEIQSLYFIPYGDKVYNLCLDKTSTLICNGIYAGDFEIQNSFERLLYNEITESPLQQQTEELFSKLNL